MRKKRPVKCVHCCKMTTDWNDDHVFPKSWYPETTPLNLEKWKIPSCVKCNTEYGGIEQDLLLRFAHCLDPIDPNVASIIARVKRSISPECGNGKKDVAARQGKRKEFLGQLIHGNQIPDQGVYPGFGNNWNLPKSKLTAVLIPAESVRRLAEKIVRGIVYLEDKRYIEPPFRISFFAVDESKAASVKEVITQHGIRYAREPGIVVWRAVLPEDGMTSLFYIEIWNSFRMYASVGCD